MRLAASHMTGSQASSVVEHDAVATVLIIGASRGIGLEAVKAALEAGHSVRALARSARRIRVDHPQLEKMAGDALEMATVKRALTGIDVVIQSLGVSAGPEIILKPTRFFSKATRSDAIHQSAQRWQSASNMWTKIKLGTATCYQKPAFFCLGSSRS
jgi:NAD(P)-dependent dehydrogenase (short-subunit alcohol dehydrogenase family)